MAALRTALFISFSDERRPSPELALAGGSAREGAAFLERVS